MSVNSKEKINKKTVLIVDDNSINRDVLSKLLKDEFETVEAENGKEALQLLNEHSKKFSAILLDLIMPVMDGYKFLEILKETLYVDIPVIVTTVLNDNEKENLAFDLGAWDFISKPYNEKILKSRLRNAISRSESAIYERLRYLLEYDTNTNIFNKTTFFNITKRMLEINESAEFAFIKFDISRFSLINSFYGTETADSILKFIAQVLRKYCEDIPGKTFGRIEADVFATCIMCNSKKDVINFVEKLKNEIREYPIDFNIVVTFGIYMIQDKTMPIYKMFDYANLASKQVKRNYMMNYAFYEPRMSTAIETEQEIVNEMNDALESDQFIIYLQPKYDLGTNLPSGAEALVRWQHPEKGLISPGVFIPIFERNGFITKLDNYVWEKTCRLLRHWLDTGFPVMPISINVSQVNLYNPYLVEIICSLVDKYSIPRNLFNIEVTESAYASNPQILRTTVKRLRDNGFIVMMDDFGSGYSSLNILKDIEFDVLKIDMKFLANSEYPGRGENIIASVVRMAKWLNMPTIAEGVEKESQVEFLRSIGCEFVQGYYFAKPMPVNDYEKLINETINQIPKYKAQLTTDAIIDSSPEIKKYLNNRTQAVGLYEYDGSSIKTIRVNDAFYDIFGYEDKSFITKSPENSVKKDYWNVVLNAFESAVQSNGSSICKFLRICHYNTYCWVRMSIEFLKKVNDKYILLGRVLQISSQIDESQKALTTFESKKGTNKMLVINDSEPDLRFIRNTFIGYFTVLHAGNSEQAIELLNVNEDVELILLDYSIMQNDKIDFLDYKKKDSILYEIPTILILENENERKNISTIMLGIDDCITKPFITNTITNCVTNVLSSHKNFLEVLREYNNAILQARTDSLTGVYNRVTAQTLISDILNSHPDDLHAMAILDVDKFKSINSKSGHDFGDNILVNVAAKLKTFFRNTDIVSRFGGDEFCIFMSNISSGNAAFNKCTELCREIQTMSLGKNGSQVSVSVGIALSSSEACTFETLYRNAELALYESKRGGRGHATLSGFKATSISNESFQNSKIINMFEDMLIVSDFETDKILYISNSGLDIFGIDDVSNMTCYELIQSSTEECPFCVKNSLSYEYFYRWSYVSKRLNKKFLVKSKLIDYDGRKAHLQLIIDVVDVDTDVNYVEHKL